MEMNDWSHNQTEVIRIALAMGKFPERKVIENMMGKLPVMPEPLIRDFSRTSEWGYDTWMAEWGSEKSKL